MDRDERNGPSKFMRGYDRQAEVDRARDAALREGNPPRTTTAKFTSTNFGTTGSGEAELEPGAEQG